MAVTAEMIKELRQQTGAGVLDCKKALEQYNGDMEKAAAYLKEKGLAAAAKKADRVAAEGRIEAYVHPGNRVGVLLEVNCETDFVARTPDFEALCHDLAMQIAAMKPRWVSREDVPAEVLAEEKRQYLQQLEGENKPAHIVERIIEGKLEKFYQENCLLEQAFIKDDSKTVRQLVTEAIARLGENIVVARFARFSIDRA
ncbi:MAG: translation elongation factor Ts [Chloroflexi bacterium]|nr:translation elongation factor Ts [Chloroflexota bacterium]